MNSGLPVPTPRRDLGNPNPDLAAAFGVASRTWHQRSPRMERVTCLDCFAGLLATGGGRVCCIWDTGTHALRLRIVVDQPINAVWMTRDRASIVLASGSTVRVHDLATGALRYAYGHDAMVTSVHVGNRAAVLASADATGRIQLREFASGRPMQDLRHPPGHPIVFVHRDHYVLIESQTHCTLVDTATGASVRRFPYDPREKVAIDGPLLDTTLVSHSGSVLRWFDCNRLEGAYCTRNLGSAIQSIDMFGSLVLAATESGALFLFDLTSGAPLARYESFTRPILFARFGDNASIMVAGGEALVMQLIDGQHVLSYCDESPPLVAMALHPGRQALLTSDRDGGIARFDLCTGRRQPSYAGHSGSVSAVACSDGWVAGGAYDGTLRLWRWDASPAATIDLAQGPVQSIALEPAEGRIWAGTWSGKVTCLDIATGAALCAIDAFSSSVRTLTIDTTRQLLGAGGDEGELKIFNLRAHSEALLELRQPGPVYRAIFDHDGDLLTAADDGVRRYRVPRLEQRMTYAGNGIRWFDVRGERLCSLSLAGELRLFDVATGQLLQRTQIDAPVNHRSVGWLNADRLLTASADGRVRVFDAMLRPVATLEVLRRGFMWCTPGRDGRTGWLFTDRTDRVDIGELTGGLMESWDATDARRDRHLVVWNSAAHVMKAVNGNMSAPPTSSLALGVTAGLARIGHRLGHSPE